jgi:hypothetical protein
MKWAEAERELAVRGVILPTNSTNYEYWEIQKDLSTLKPEVHDPKEIPPQP